MRWNAICCAQELERSGPACAADTHAERLPCSFADCRHAAARLPAALASRSWAATGRRTRVPRRRAPSPRFAGGSTGARARLAGARPGGVVASCSTRGYCPARRTTRRVAELARRARHGRSRRPTPTASRSSSSYRAPRGLAPADVAGDLDAALFPDATWRVVGRRRPRSDGYCDDIRSQ